MLPRGEIGTADGICTSPGKRWKERWSAKRAQDGGSHTSSTAGVPTPFPGPRCDLNSAGTHPPARPACKSPGWERVSREKPRAAWCITPSTSAAAPFQFLGSAAAGASMRERDSPCYIYCATRAHHLCGPIIAVRRPGRRQVFIQRRLPSQGSFPVGTARAASAQG